MLSCSFHAIIAFTFVSYLAAATTASTLASSTTSAGTTGTTGIVTEVPTTTSQPATSATTVMTTIAGTTPAQTSTVTASTTTIAEPEKCPIDMKDTAKLPAIQFSIEPITQDETNVAFDVAISEESPVEITATVSAPSTNLPLVKIIKFVLSLPGVSLTVTTLGSDELGAAPVKQVIPEPTTDKANEVIQITRDRGLPRYVQSFLIKLTGQFKEPQNLKIDLLLDTCVKPGGYSMVC